MQAASVGAQGGVERSVDGAVIIKQLRREALACYEAAGIECATPEELRDRNSHNARKVQMFDLPGRPRHGGSSWQSVSRGAADIETDYLNGEIVLLGQQHGIDVTANEVCQELGQQMVRETLEVGHFPPAVVRERVESRLGRQLPND